MGKILAEYHFRRVALLGDIFIRNVYNSTSLKQPLRASMRMLLTDGTGLLMEKLAPDETIADLGACHSQCIGQLIIKCAVDTCPLNIQ